MYSSLLMSESLLSDLLKSIGPAAASIIIMWYWLKDVMASRNALRDEMFSLIDFYQKQNEEQQEKLEALNERIYQIQK